MGIDVVKLVEGGERKLSRQDVTRIVCVGLVVGTASLLLVGMVALLAAFAGYALSYHPALSVIGVAIILIPGSALSLWRRCDRCKGRLFSDERMSGGGGRDYRAVPFLNSYRVPLIWRTAVKGELRCQWCGHMDGQRPDYTVEGR